MGQRLTVTLSKGDKNIASIYFHWSGYSKDALSITDEILSNIDSTSNLDQMNPVEIALSLFSLYGYNTGLEKVEEEYISNNYPKLDLKTLRWNSDRNEGLISVSPEEIQNSVEAGEMLVNIDLEKNTVIGEYLYHVDDEYEDDVVECKELSIDPTAQMSFDDYQTFVCEVLGEDPSSCDRNTFIYNGITYHMIA